MEDVPSVHASFSYFLAVIKLDLLVRIVDMYDGKDNNNKSGLIDHQFKKF